MGLQHEWSPGEKSFSKFEMKISKKRGGIAANDDNNIISSFYPFLNTI